MSGLPGERGRFLLLVLGLTLLHAVVAVSLPLSGDEAYYWDCSRHPSWSYFDQPPLVIWLMIPFRALLGETRLAVRAPAVLASLVIGLVLWPLVRRLGGGPRHAAGAVLVLHATPLVMLGSSYASTDVVMAACYLAATWAAVALAQGEGRAWWGFAAAVGLGFLAKFPVVLVLPALLPALWEARVRRDLRTPRPYMAAALCCLLTSPVWIWALENDWANITFQLRDRHRPASEGLRLLLEFVAGNLLLATPFLAVAAVVAWWVARRRTVPGWRVALVAAASPLVFFAAVSLRTRVAPHWSAPGLMVALALVALVPFRGRRVLAAAGGICGLAVSIAAVTVVMQAERLVDLGWHYQGRPRRISTDKLAAVIGNREILRRVSAAQRPHELVASESYSTVHLLGFLSEGRLPTRLAHVKPGTHGLASLYWYRPEEFLGRDVLFVTSKRGVDEKLRAIFADVSEEPAIEIVRGGRVVRTVRLLRCRDLQHPEGVFTR